MNSNPPILVTGATGYVGGRLIPRLIAAGHNVRAAGRSLEKMAARPWACNEGVELVQCDVLDRGALIEAATGCKAAYYLVHAMIASKKQFAEADRQSAENMRAAAEAANLQQVIYLGGLGDAADPTLSHHLASRHQVGQILESGPVPVTTLNAAMILGSGSASFEILRYLVERLPFMITPKWVHTPTQPIAISNAVDYLVGALDNPRSLGERFDIGGPDVVDYQQLIDMFAEEARLPKRRLLKVPVLTPKLSALWIHLVTPVPGAIAQPLTQGLGVPTACKENRIREIIPADLISCRQAINMALDQLLTHQVETCWSDAGALNPPEWAACGDADYAGGTLLTCAYTIAIDKPPKKIWPMVAGVGGENGYYFGNQLWRLRGILDRLVGGIGLRRGRRHPTQLHTGDALDFWRVLRAEPERRLTLMAEMKIPGEALLDIRIQPIGDKKTDLVMVSRFMPRGLAGILYWYALYPLHVLVFKGMLSAMAKKISPGRTNRPLPWQPAAATVCQRPDT